MTGPMGVATMDQLPRSTGPLGPSGRLVLLGIVLVATALSIAATGFEYGISNNVFHIPYLLRYEELPAFRDDAFYRTLDRFTSMIWPLLRAVATEGNVRDVMLASHVVSRAAALLALMWLLRVNGLDTWASAAVALLGIAGCAWLTGASIVGAHGLFIQYFTHSEVAWAAVFAAVAARQQRRPMLSAAFAGCAFLVNAFVGIWMVALLLMTALARDGSRADCRRIATSALVFAAVGSPVAIWIGLAIQDGGRVPAFSYVHYIRTYYPQHFLIEAASARQLMLLGLVACCGFVAAFLSRDRRFWWSLLGACVVLVVVGAAAPYAFDHRFVFNLHLLRCDGVLQFLSLAICIAVLADTLVGASNPPALRMVAAVAAGMLLTPRAEPVSLLVCLSGLCLLAVNRWHADARAPGHRLWTRPLVLSTRFVLSTPLALAFAALAMAAQALLVGLSGGAWLRWSLLAALLCLLGGGRRDRQVVLVALWGALVLAAVTGMRNAREGVPHARTSAKWQELVQWVRGSSLSGPFLVPVDERSRATFDLFQLQAGRPVWVDWKQGAAVMWAPGFYWQWMPRAREVLALSDAHAFGAYAIDKGIPALVLPGRLGACPAHTDSVFDNGDYRVCTVDRR